MAGPSRGHREAGTGEGGCHRHLVDSRHLHVISQRASLFAHAIHSISTRKGGPFIAVNCGSIPAQLVEAELFGYEAGTFTGARRQGNTGRFEDADGGTLFLDEVSELPPTAQTALLRVLQEKEVVRLGGSAPRSVDVRVVAATNKPLGEEIRAKRFRRDLYYRLNVLSISVPALRERGDDIDFLAQVFLAEAEGLELRARRTSSSASPERRSTAGCASTAFRESRDLTPPSPATRTLAARPAARPPG